jgi:outer membrane lipoprotein-sorting protein
MSIYIPSKKPLQLLSFLIFLGLTTTILVSQSFTNAEPTAIEVIRKAQEKMQGKTSIAEIKITITRPKWSRSMELKSWGKTTKYGMTLITAPARDRGTVFLKKDKEVWNWVPSVERTIKLPPSMMSQSWMGTDLTNDDLVKESSMVDDFNHTYLGKDSVFGRNCYQISSIPKEDAAVVWGKVVNWVDITDYIQMKTEFYDEDDELVNTFTASNITKMGGIMIASKVNIIPADKPGQKTQLEYLSLVLNSPIDDDFFTTQNMKKVK